MTVGLNTVVRTLVMAILAFAAAGSVIYLQHRFDAGDRKAALRVVEEFRAPNSKRSIPDVLRLRHPEPASIALSAITDSSCLQRIRVSAVVDEMDKERRGTNRTVYEFVVDINRVHITPGNELGRVAIGELDAPLGFSAAGTSTSPSQTSPPRPPPSLSPSLAGSSPLP
ncbi:MAG: hypothetical protein NVS3B20_03180 [Polyangiales bacterium]